MASVASGVAGEQHRDLMDEIYAGQRHIYDFTRKYYLFGRDGLIDGLAVTPGALVLEIACGTGRNLARIGGRWPGARLYGLDISSEMLKSAAARLGDGATVVWGDACSFDSGDLFGMAGFDRVVLSYALSMIPDWQAALARAIAGLAPGGQLHIVDFGDLAGCPVPFRAGLRRWLAHFHVTPRLELAETARALAEAHGLRCQTTRGALGYYQLLIISPPN